VGQNCREKRKCVHPVLDHQPEEEKEGRNSGERRGGLPWGDDRWRKMARMKSPWRLTLPKGGAQGKTIVLGGEEDLFVFIDCPKTFRRGTQWGSMGGTLSLKRKKRGSKRRRKRFIGESLKKN